MRCINTSRRNEYKLKTTSAHRLNATLDNVGHTQCQTIVLTTKEFAIFTLAKAKQFHS